MIELKKTLYGLSKMQFAYIDQDVRAKSTFHIYEFPETFYLGKNQFKIFIDKENLVEGSQIYIDILDSNQNPIYYKISNLISPDKTRPIIVHIYDSTPIGEMTVLIAGRLKRNPINGREIPFSNSPTSVDFKDNPNVIWKGKSNISLTENVTDIIFNELPSITYAEVRFPIYSNPSTGSRRVELKASSSQSITLQSNNSSRDLQSNNREKDKIGDGRVIDSFPSSFSGSITIEPSQRLPENLKFSIINSSNLTFTSSMEGGQIEVRNITYSYPRNYLTASAFVPLVYSGSIVKVVSPSLIEVYPPFSRQIDYKDTEGNSKSIIVDRFSNHSNFTTSFASAVNFTSASNEFKSYLKLQIESAEPEYGSVKKLQIGYKEIGTFGQKNDLGFFPVQSRNILIDQSKTEYSPKDGIQYKDIGSFKEPADANRYWSGSSNNEGFDINFGTRSSKIDNGIEVQFSVLTDSTKFYRIFLTQSYLPEVKSNTEYELRLTSAFNEGPSIQLPSQIDVYISGSAKIEDRNINKSLGITILKENLGTYIGSIDGRQTKQVQSNSFPFKISSEGTITPILVARSNQFDFGNVEIKPRNSPGYSPNFIETFINLPEANRSSELMIDIQYLNSKNHPSEYSSKVYGIQFLGNTTSSISIPSGLISGSDQLTSSLDLRYERKGRNIVSGSEQLTSSYDVRYERKGTGIYSSSGQLGPTGIYSGSGYTPRDTQISASNLQILTQPNDDSFVSGIIFNTTINSNTNLNEDYSGSMIMFVGPDGQDQRSWIRFTGEERLIEFNSTDLALSKFAQFSVQNGNSFSSYSSGSEGTLFILSGERTYFQDNRINKIGIEYFGNYTSSLINNSSSLTDVRTVRKLISSSNLFISSSNQINSGSFSGSFNGSGAGLTGIVSSSFATTASYYQLPAGLISGSSFSGSFQGNGSGLTNINSSSYAATASYSLIPSGTYGSITTVTDGGGVISINHSLGSIPIIAMAIASGSTPLFCTINKRDTTTVSFIVWRSNTGTTWPTLTASIDWLVR